MDTTSVAQSQVVFQPTCPICSQPDTKRATYRPYRSHPKIINAVFVCTRGHLWEVCWLEGQEDQIRSAVA